MIKRTDLLSVDITLSCNLLCHGCNKFVYPIGSGYMMSENELNTILELVAPRLSINYIRLIGGEPLAHPNFIDIVRIIQDAGYKVEVATNGLLLDDFGPDFLDSLLYIKISNYGMRNKASVDKYKYRHNVIIINSMDVWRDPEIERNIMMSEADGDLAYQRCPMGTIKVCNWKVWDCCAAEAVERHYDLEPTYVNLDSGWYENLDRTSRASTCRRCYFGMDTVNNLRMEK